MYFFKPPRTYILTRREQESNEIVCPKCGKTLSLIPFTKSDKLYRCDGCSFHIQKSYVLSFSDKGGISMKRISTELSRIAKEISSSIVTSERAYSYLVLHGGFKQSELSVQPKDRMRITDMNSKASRKGYMDTDKFLALCRQMAASIKDAEKAYRRGLAVLHYAEVEKSMREKLASEFFSRAVELG